MYKKFQNLHKKCKKYDATQTAKNLKRKKGRDSVSTSRVIQCNSKINERSPWILGRRLDCRGRTIKLTEHHKNRQNVRHKISTT